MDQPWRDETEKLKESWMQHDADFLREYLVSGVEDPRLNLQSVLARHTLVGVLFGEQFSRLMREELRFAAVMNWTAQTWPQLGGAEDLLAIRHALVNGSDDAEGIRVPRYARDAFATLPLDCPGGPVPNYLDSVFAAQVDDAGVVPAFPDEAASTFEHLWNRTLAQERPRSISVLELACGSANDYRYLDRFGLSRHLEYTGVDLCEKNIANARAMFPGVHFLVGNVLDLPWAETRFDVAVVQDLFEHLSPAGLDQAMGQVCRVTRRMLCLGFFNLHEGAEHQVRPLERYHWNCLSVPRLRTLLAQHGFEARVIHIDTLLKWQFGCADTHNKNAYTFLAERTAPEALDPG